MKSAEYWIDNLKLEAHPEGGFFRESYRSSESIPIKGLPNRFNDSRSFSTAIYFLLRSSDRSLFHRIKSDELWHFYAGSSLSIYVLNQQRLSVYKLGPTLENQESLQLVIPKNSWFGARVNDPASYVLAGCTVAPGFDFQDFEMATREDLIKEFPLQAEIITLLT